MIYLIDSHCHIDILNYLNLHKNYDDVLKKAYLNNVHFLLTISTNLTNCKSILSKIKKYSQIKSSCGVHPLSKNKYFEYSLENLIQVSKNKNIISLGETGLDYSYDIKDSIKKLQIKSLKKHIRAGIYLNKPIVIHMRHSEKDILKVFKEEEIEKCGGVIHCFTSDIKTAKKFLDLGLYISFSGIITFKNAYYINDVLSFVPMDRLLIETDSPYLSPEPFRGKENQPAWLKYIALHVAKIKNINIKKLSNIIKNNFCNLFKIKLT